jgi:hypothetical protein
VYTYTLTGSDYQHMDWDAMRLEFLRMMEIAMALNPRLVRISERFKTFQNVLMIEAASTVRTRGIPAPDSHAAPAVATRRAMEWHA